MNKNGLIWPVSSLRLLMFPSFTCFFSGVLFAVILHQASSTVDPNAQSISPVPDSSVNKEHQSPPQEMVSQCSCIIYNKGHSKQLCVVWTIVCSASILFIFGRSLFGGQWQRLAIVASNKTIPIFHPHNIYNVYNIIMLLTELNFWRVLGEWGKPHIWAFWCFLSISLHPVIKKFWNFIYILSLTLSKT